MTSELGENIEITMDGKFAVIKIDTTKNFGPSQSGKTLIVASTHGNVPIPGTNVIIGLNAYTRRR